MSKTVFKKVDYTLGGLIDAIAMGQIGLPDIQRPFIWKNAKVRDLFDSMYRGFPVGYLLFWENGLAGEHKTIGTDQKQKTPSLLIVDGQQRLTSLYAVIRDIPVIRNNYLKEHIHIAFNPIEAKFEVTDSAIQRNKNYISDISKLWHDETDLFEVVEKFLSELESTRDISSEDKTKIRKAITRLHGLLGFPFTALELSAAINEESVSEVFVRINYQGESLKQADFILTLMSVFWDEGRTELEHFCRDSRIPSIDKPSPFNHFIKPKPDQLLRVSVGNAFKRARLKYVYSLLRGKDLETEKFSEEKRIEQFKLLKQAQSRVLNLTYWHDFMKCLQMAGFRSEKMISSQNNLIFSYMLYLLGRTEYKVEAIRLRDVIARWFFMSSLTFRFSSSPESSMEFDLARFREIKGPNDFVNTLTRICEQVLTDDFWKIKLPNDLATSSAISPSLNAYNASLILLDAHALFSKLKISELLDPTIKSNKSAVERHHLFPRNHLKTLEITEIRDTNQIANYAFVEWIDNVNISDLAPLDYVPILKERFNKDEIEKMNYWHALPDDWENMEYRTFLETRRELIANIIKEGYYRLINGQTDQKTDQYFDINDFILIGESSEAEFKSTLRTNLHTGQKDMRMEQAILRTIAGFLNTNDGKLFVGISDDGSAVGIEPDDFPNEDKMSLHLVNIVKSRINPQAMTNINLHFEDYEDQRILVVECKKSTVPVFVKDKDSNIERFYIRTGPSTSELSASQTQDYIKQCFQ